MGINKRSLVSRNPFICFGTTKFLYKSNDIKKLSHNNNIFNSFINLSSKPQFYYTKVEFKGVKLI